MLRHIAVNSRKGIGIAGVWGSVQVSGGINRFVMLVWLSGFFTFTNPGRFFAMRVFVFNYCKTLA
jgi:hypothetical protein